MQGKPKYLQAEVRIAGRGRKLLKGLLFYTFFYRQKIIVSYQKQTFNESLFTDYYPGKMTFSGTTTIAIDNNHKSLVCYYSSCQVSVIEW